jgi:hypothetical protein
MTITAARNHCSVNESAITCIKKCKDEIKWSVKANAPSSAKIRSLKSLWPLPQKKKKKEEEEDGSKIEMERVVTLQNEVYKDVQKNTELSEMVSFFVKSSI